LKSISAVKSPVGAHPDIGRKFCGSCPTYKENALKTGRLEQALRTKLKADNKESIEIFAKGFDNNKQNSQ